MTDQEQIAALFPVGSKIRVTYHTGPAFTEVREVTLSTAEQIRMRRPDGGPAFVPLSCSGFGGTTEVTDTGFKVFTDTGEHVMTYEQA